MDWKNEGRITLWLVILFLGVFLFLGAGKISDHQITHASPTGMMASDAFTHNWVAQNTYDTGYIDTPPNYAFDSKEEAEQKVGNYKLFHPPVLPLLTASITQLSGLNLYDINILLVFLFIVLMVALNYFILAKFNETLALFSLPLSLLFLSGKFFISLSWGWWDFLTGEFFLLATILIILSEKFSFRYIVLAVFISITFMAHGVEAGYLGLFVFLYLFFSFIFRRKELSLLLLEQVQSFLLVIPLVLYFLPVIFKTMGAMGYAQVRALTNSQFITQIYNGSPPNYFVYFNEFLYFQGVILLGIFVLFYFLIKKRNELLPYISFVIIMSLFPYLYFTAGERGFQWRFLWPIYLSFSFGAVVYLIYSLIKRFIPSKFPLKFLFILGTFTTVIVFVLPLPFFGAGLIDQSDYASYLWIHKNSNTYDKLFILYSPINNQISRLYLLKRDWFVSTSETWQNMNLKESKLTRVEDHDPSSFFCERKDCSFFEESKFVDKVVKEKISSYKNISVCSVDYIYLPLKNQQEIFNKNVQYLQYLVQNNITQIVFQNEAAVIGKNTLKGEACESKFKS
ncbi:hypothetical protein J4417_05175 [Candidatus Woesearchaeota archaeon]|nr:hypothetical protein [Candidatus Woesearchaeota archaeon]